jgi:hypothetical protein
LTPSLCSLVSQPESFVFCNFEFPRLRLSDPENLRIQKTTTIWRKLRFFAKEIMLPSWPIFLLWFATAVRPGWEWLRTRQLGNPAAGLWLLLFPFILLGCCAPSRYQLQHFFVFVPVLLMAVVSGGRLQSQMIQYKSLAIYAVLAVSCFFAFRSAGDYAAIANLAKPREWYPFRLIRQVEELQMMVPTGQVLTLAPTLPLVVELSVYPELSTGTFGWRSARLVAPERRQRLHLVAPGDLEAFLSARPPAAVLTGVEEDEEEAPLIAWAKRNGFQAKQIKKRRTVWLPPARF